MTRPPVGRRRRLVVGLLVLSACGESEPPVQDAPPPGPVDELSALADVVAAERAFSAASVADGTRAAFLAWFADDAVSFAPAPLRGTDHIAAWPTDGPPLEWAPEFADVSADGSLGYTMGPYRQDLPDGRTAWGHYHTMWRRSDAGEWRVALDIGTPHGPVPWPGSEVGRPLTRSSAAPALATPGGDLLEADRRYATAHVDDGRRTSAEAFLDERVRVSRPGAPPRLDRDAALADQEQNDERLEWIPQGAESAGSGDLGATWGTGTMERDDLDGSPRPMSYARFWRRDGGGEWRVVVEVVSPHPTPPPGG